VTVKHISHATIFSLDSAILNAQFRVLPYLIIDNRPLLDSTCDLQYKWVSDGHLKLRGMTSKRTGVNVTAVKEGSSILTLEIMDRKGEVMFVTTKEIVVHRDVGI